MHLRLCAALIVLSFTGCASLAFEGATDTRSAPPGDVSFWVPAGSGAVLVTEDPTTAFGNPTVRFTRVDADGRELGAIELTTPALEGRLSVVAPNEQVAYLFWERQIDPALPPRGAFETLTRFDDQGATQLTVAELTDGVLAEGWSIVAHDERLWVSGLRSDGTPRIAEFNEGAWTDALPLHDAAAPTSGDAFEIRAFSGHPWMREVRDGDETTASAWVWNGAGWDEALIPDDAARGVAFDGESIFLGGLGDVHERWNTSDGTHARLWESPVAQGVVPIPGGGFLGIRQFTARQCLGWTICGTVVESAELVRLDSGGGQWRALSEIPTDYVHTVLLDGQPWLWSPRGLTRVDLSAFT